MPWIRVIVVWGIIIGAETLHGIARTLLLAPLVGDLQARQISVITGSLIIFAIAWLLIRWIQLIHRRQLLLAGLIWVLLTLAFEIGLGILLGYSWERISEDYQPARGGFLGFGLTFMLFTPLLAARARAGHPASNERSMSLNR